MRVASLSLSLLVVGGDFSVGGRGVAGRVCSTAAGHKLDNAPASIVYYRGNPETNHPQGFIGHLPELRLTCH